MFGYKPHQLALRSIITIGFFLGMASFIVLMMKSFGIAFHHITDDTLLKCLFCNICVTIAATFALAMSELE